MHQRENLLFDHPQVMAKVTTNISKVTAHRTM